MIPEETENGSSVQKAPSQAPSAPPAEVPPSPQRSQVASAVQSPKMPSQLMSPRGKVPSQVASQNGSPAKTASQVTKQSMASSRQQSQLSRADQRSGLSRMQSPDGLDTEQRRMVHSALLAQNQTPRTSYYDQSVNQELTGHFHDDELCQLLRHESDTSQPEVIRKALRKAIRQRVKRLGIKYDTEVRFVDSIGRSSC